MAINSLIQFMRFGLSGSLCNIVIKGVKTVLDAVLGAWLPDMLPVMLGVEIRCAF